MIFIYPIMRLRIPVLWLYKNKTANKLMITPVHFLVQYPITTKTIPPKEKYAFTSGVTVPMENDKSLNIVVAYSTILTTSLL